MFELIMKTTMVMTFTMETMMTMMTMMITMVMVLVAAVEKGVGDDDDDDDNNHEKFDGGGDCGLRGDSGRTYGVDCCCL